MFIHAKKGIVRLNFAVSLAVIGILIVYVLTQLEALNAQIETDKMLTEVQTFRLQLAENWISNNIRHKNTDISLLKNSNPMLLISDIPKHYIGESDEMPKNVSSVWFYHTKMQHLVYIMANGKDKHFKLKKMHNGSLSTLYPSGGLDLATVETEP